MNEIKDSDFKEVQGKFGIRNSEFGDNAKIYSVRIKIFLSTCMGRPSEILSPCSFTHGVPLADKNYFTKISVGYEIFVFACRGRRPRRPGLHKINCLC